MVYELNCRYIADPNTDILLESGEIVSLDTYIQMEVASRHPAYIVGDSIQAGCFSIRFPSPLDRQDAIDFITAVKPYLMAGIVKLHLCRHDEGKPCEAVETLEVWGGMTDE
jgi:hypothetical protein